jgi:hypothetical protein
MDVFIAALFVLVALVCCNYYRCGTAQDKWFYAQASMKWHPYFLIVALLQVVLAATIGNCLYHILRAFKGCA